MTRKAACFVNHRLRTGLVGQIIGLTGNIEVDETYIGGKHRNMRKKRKVLARLGRGTVGKVIVIGALSRKTCEVVLPVILDTKKETLQAFVEDVAQEGMSVYTDEHKRHVELDRKGNRKHENVRQSRGEYVNGNAGTDCMESLWAEPKRMYHGTWHQVSKNM